MAWSTRELARLSGTTINTIRYYHRLGILEEPERRYNGYKQYGVSELVRLLKIRRLADLGVPLALIDAVGRADDGIESSMQKLRSEIDDGIARLQKARVEVSDILENRAPPDGPAGFESLAAHLSPADSAIIHIYSQLYDAEALEDVKKMVAADTEGIGLAISALPSDADDAIKQLLAERMAPNLAQNIRDYPWLGNPMGRLSRSASVTQETFIQAMVELYNPAALDVIQRAHLIAEELVRTRSEQDGDAT